MLFEDVAFYRLYDVAGTKFFDRVDNKNGQRRIGF